MNTYYQFLLAVIIVGYFLANILEGTAYLDYILFFTFLYIVVKNKEIFKKYLKK